MSNPARRESGRISFFQSLSHSKQCSEGTRSSPSPLRGEGRGGGPTWPQRSNAPFTLHSANTSKGTTTMTIKIEKKIKGYEVVKPEDKAAPAPQPTAVEQPKEAPMAEVIQMHESLERPEALIG